MQSNVATVFLIPSVIDESAVETIPPYIVDAALQCKVFFVENERTARRFLKSIHKAIVIDDYEWHTIHKAEEAVLQTFKTTLATGKTIGILSEAGSPGIADPGQVLIDAAQKAGATVKPLVGPNSIILALMASGMNGQEFTFNGYLPIDARERAQKIKQCETLALQGNTQIFIETPYRNVTLLEALCKNCNPTTRLCIASGITGKDESIISQTIASWKKQSPAIHKIPAIFILGSA